MEAVAEGLHALALVVEVEHHLNEVVEVVVVVVVEHHLNEVVEAVVVVVEHYLNEVVEVEVVEHQLNDVVEVEVEHHLKDMAVVACHVKEGEAEVEVKNLLKT